MAIITSKYVINHVHQLKISVIDCPQIFKIVKTAFSKAQFISLTKILILHSLTKILY